MASPTKAVVISHDTLRAIGLKHLLEACFDVDTTLLPDDGTDPGRADIYFITPEALVKMHRHFMPRMRQTVVLTQEPVRSHVLTLDTTRSEADIVAALRPIVDSLNPRDDIPELTEREVQVLRLVAMGHLNKEVASMLGITLNTVISHRKNITAKLNIRSASGLTIYAMINGLLSNPADNHSSHPHPSGSNDLNQQPER